MDKQNLKQNYLPQLIVFLSQHNYIVCGYDSQKKGKDILSTIHIQEAEYAIFLNAVKKEQNVSIKISYTDYHSYEMIKQEAEDLKKLLHLNCVVQFIDEYDFEDYSVFILITESYEKSMETILQDINNPKKQLSVGTLVNIFYQLLFQLFELHENKYFHGNIKPSSIVINSNGEYKYRDIISLEHIYNVYTDKVEEEQYQKQQSNNSYFSPEIKELLSRRENTEIKDIQSALKLADIYSLGLVFLNLIGIQINDEIHEQLQTQQFDGILKRLPLEKIKLFSFLRNYMLNKNADLRNTANQLRKNMFYQYEDVYLFKDQEILKLKAMLQQYEQNRKLSEHYKTYLICQLIQFELINSSYVNAQYSKKQLTNLEKKTYENNHFLLQEMGQTYFYFRDYKNYVRFCLKALELRQNQYPEDHQLIAESLKEVGNGYKHIDTNFENSFKYMALALDTYQNLYEQFHESIAETIKSIGVNYIQYKSYKKAQQYFKVSLDIRKYLYVDNHLYISDVIGEIIQCYRYQFDYDQTFNWSLKNFQMKNVLYNCIPIEDLTFIFSIIVKFKDPHKRLKYNLKVLDQLNTIQNCNKKIKADILQSISFNYLEIRDFETAQIYEIQQNNLLSQL